MRVCVCVQLRSRETVPISRQSVARRRGTVVVTRPTVGQQWRAIQTRERKLTLVGRFAIPSCNASVLFIGTRRRQKTAACWWSPLVRCMCVWQASSLHTRSPGGANDFTIVMSPDRAKPLKLLCMCPRASVYPSLNGGFQTV